LNRFLQVLSAKLKGKKIGLSHVGDADGIVCGALFLRAYPDALLLLVDPWEIKDKWSCWLNWFTWDYVADLPSPRKAILRVDHHKSNPPRARVEFYDPSAPSAAVLALKALHLEDDKISNALAKFATECDTAKIESPEAWDLNDAVKGSPDEERIKLARWLAQEGIQALKKPEVQQWIEVNRARRARTAALADKISVSELVFIKLPNESQISVRNLMITLERRGAKFTCVITPRGKRFKIHLGCKEDSGYDCSEIAKALGGGGHPYASGATVDDLKTALEKVRKHLGLEKLKIIEFKEEDLQDLPKAPSRPSSSRGVS